MLSYHVFRINDDRREISFVVKRAPDARMEPLQMSAHAGRVAGLGLNDDIAIQTGGQFLVLQFYIQNFIIFSCNWSENISLSEMLKAN